MKRLLLFFSLIMAQATLTLAVAYIFMGALQSGAASTILTYDGTDYVGATGAERIEAELSDKMAGLVETGSARIRFGQDEFMFGLSEIDLALDMDALKKDIDANSRRYYASSLFSAFRNPYHVEFVPAYRLDSKKLLDKLLLIKELIGYEPVNAGIDLVGGEIVKSASAEGLSYDVDVSLPKVLAALESQPFRRYTLAGPEAASNVREVRIVKPVTSSEALEDIDGIIAEASTPIMDESSLGTFVDAAISINRVLVFADNMYGEFELVAGKFSLRNYLGDVSATNPYGGGYVQIPDDAASQVASTVFIAALEAGIDFERIFFTPSIDSPAYCEQGFGVMYEANGADFQFENSLESNIVLFAAVEDGRFTVRIAGHTGGAAPGPGAQKTLSTETKTTNDMQVVYVYRDGELIYKVEYPEEGVSQRRRLQINTNN